MSRERWVTKEGVSSNIAEGRNNILKQAFRSYYYVSPKWSQVYLDELSFLGNLRYNTGLASLFFTGSYEDKLIEPKGYTKTSYTTRKQVRVETESSGAFRCKDYQLSSFVARSNDFAGGGTCPLCGNAFLAFHTPRHAHLDLRLPAFVSKDFAPYGSLIFCSACRSSPDTVLL